MFLTNPFPLVGSVWRPRVLHAQRVPDDAAFPDLESSAGAPRLVLPSFELVALKVCPRRLLLPSGPVAADPAADLVAGPAAGNVFACLATQGSNAIRVERNVDAYSAVRKYLSIGCLACPRDCFDGAAGVLHG